MTAAELIERLQQLPSDTKVIIDLDWTYQPVTALEHMVDGSVAIR